MVLKLGKLSLELRLLKALGPLVNCSLIFVVEGVRGNGLVVREFVLFRGCASYMGADDEDTGHGDRLRTGHDDSVLIYALFGLFGSCSADSHRESESG
ncbi:Uu.00g013640.m01.CDS01 [Anthostomella pinea]|uniref:Uu.00g013640.m01.CDS01 n=1 Tax=Anthostomella pinea TaxID=933095 RepID=A0AAI8VZ30_9PEZI|nr:Uu.00g013640.m01.CDS01 [Anthostomella pinea]